MSISIKDSTFTAYCSNNTSAGIAATKEALTNKAEQKSNAKPEDSITSAETTEMTASKPTQDQLILRRYLELSASEKAEWNRGLDAFQKIKTNEEEDIEPLVLRNYINDLIILQKALQENGLDAEIEGRVRNREMPNPDLILRDEPKILIAQLSDREALGKTITALICFATYTLNSNEAYCFSCFLEEERSTLEVEAVLWTLSQNTKNVLLADCKKIKNDATSQDILAICSDKNNQKALANYSNNRHFSGMHSIANQLKAFTSGFVVS